ncbi:hypothetical protein [Methylobacterium brachiatum]|uniref:hypothetical protein n=1 Tax=Methylobacterium brachiatum TaxID=269660 RepID=UPI0008F082BC|nr:hypothetical protein [Methylobacterium brachiatum]SFJ67664.1 hypothetical protein SAMN02799642_05133 [Methylobacterium brachiatum]
MNLAEHYATKSGLSPSAVFNAAGFLETEEGWTVFRWNEALLGPQPTAEDLAVIAALPDPPHPVEVVILYRADLYRRCTDDEADAIDAALAKQPTRIRRIFESAVTFRSDDEMWSLLHDAAVGLFGDERAVELLAAST